MIAREQEIAEQADALVAEGVDTGDPRWFDLADQAIEAGLDTRDVYRDALVRAGQPVPSSLFHDEADPGACECDACLADDQDAAEAGDQWLYRGEASPSADALIRALADERGLVLVGVSYGSDGWAQIPAVGGLVVRLSVGEDADADARPGDEQATALVLDPADLGRAVVVLTASPATPASVEAIVRGALAIADDAKAGR